MKKNFLLLFLMALLPMAGWAADISTASVAVGEITYGAGGAPGVMVVWEGETLTEGTHYEVDTHYYADADCTTDEGTNVGQLAVGTHYVKITGIPAGGFEGSASGAFSVIQAPLFLNITAVEKTYGDDPTTDYEFTVLDADDNEVAEAVVTALDIDVFVKTAAGAQFTPTATTAVGNYDFGFTYDNSGNYSLERAENDEAQYVVAAKSIAGLTVTMAAGTYTYTGENIVTPTFTVTDESTPVTTFNVKWFDAEIDANTSDANAVTPKNAGTYYARLTGTGNYGNSTYNNETWKITVNQVPLTIQVNPKSKTYDGVAYTTADVEYTYGGLVDADQGKVNKASLTPKVDGADWADFKNYKEGGYVISVDASEATIGDAIALNTNYVITTLSSIWTISQKALTIKAGNVTIGYGDAITDAEITADGAIADEEEAIAGDFEATSAQAVARGAVNNVYGVQEGVYVPVRKSPADADVTALLLNYDWDIEDAVAGNLIIGGQDFTIMPIVSSVNYDGETHAATGYVANVGTYVLTTDDIDVSTISYEYKNVTPGVTGATWVADAPFAVGIYRARVAAGVTGKGNFAEAEPKCSEVQFEIQKKPITITINGATLHIGDTEANLANHTAFSEYTLIGDETIEFKPVFAYDGDNLVAEGLTIDEETGKISYTTTADAFDGTDAITAEMVEGDNDNDNYNVTFVAGDLAIADAQLILGKADAGLDLAIDEAAASGETYNVTFDNSIDMLEKNWYAMVLPFDVTPAELVGKLGTYVVVNTLSSSTMVEKNGKQTVDVKFKLEMDNIPAGTPFIIKPAQAVNWFQDANEDEENDIVFAAEEITYEITDGTSDYATFTGTYKTGESVKWGYELDGETVDANAKYRWLCDETYGDGTRNAWLNPKSNAHELTAMEAYLILDADAEAARIFVEDFDGNTTSIKSLSVDDIQGLKVAEGWYTLGGVKLQAAPTEKGVYIKDGKKFVVK